MTLALSWLTFLGILAGGIGGAIALLDMGFAPLTVLLTLNGVALLTIVVLERVKAYMPEWNRPHRGDLKTDVVHMIFSTILPPEAFKALFFGVLNLGAIQLADTYGAPVWPHHWPLAAQVCLSAVIAEFGTYWVHRWFHEIPVLWRLHATHHSAGRLYWLNAGRFHPLDTFLEYGAEVWLLILLGINEQALMLQSLFTVILGLLQHSNIDLKLGPLNWIFSMNEMHRWHHSRVIRESNTNYGGNLIVWDVVFGTRFDPKDRQPPREIGIEDMPNFPDSYWAHLASPFRWEKIKREAGPNPAGIKAAG